jgi:hypothetical protein
MSQVLGAFGCWISTCYSPFTLGRRYETYKLFISLILKFLGGRGKPRILNQQTKGHDRTRIKKYIGLLQLLTSKNSYMLKHTRISTLNLYLLCVLFCIHGSHYINCVMYVSKRFEIVGFKTIFRSLYIVSQTVSHLLKLWIEVFIQLKVLH